MARKCCAQHLTDDHWLVLTHARLPEKKRQCNSVLKGCRPKTESDECGFGRVIVESLETAEDVSGEVSLEHITECIPQSGKSSRI